MIKSKFTRELFLKLSFLGIFFCSQLHAQIKITTPVERAVYQRGIDGRSQISIAGTYSQLIDKVEVRAVAVIPGQGIDTDWAVLQSNPSGGVFLGTVTLLGGWYSLQVRASYKNAVVASDVIPRFGVGEVFIIAGQSNGQGLRGTLTKGAEDDRVNYINNYDNTSNSISDPPAPTFAKLTSDANIAPRGQTSWCWGVLGDLLAQRLNVPILFINTAWEGTSVRNWAQSAKGEQTYNVYGGFLYAEKMPYENLRLSISHYANQLGVRSILWIQGEADNLPGRMSKEEYINHLTYIIDLAKISINKRIRWVISRTSLTSEGYGPIIGQAVIDAQNEVLSNPFFPVFPGPNTDQIGPDSRPDGTHFSTPGVSNLQVLDDVANAFFRTFTESNFFAEVMPITPAPVPSISVACNSSNNGITFTLPEGYSSYSWNNSSSTSRTLTVTSPGVYRATMRDADGNVVLSPIVNASEGIRPQRPVIVPGGELQACPESLLELSASGGPHLYRWFKDGETASAGEGVKFSPSVSGSYTVMSQNVFGCTSELSSQVSLIVRDPIAQPDVSTSGPFSVQASVPGENQIQSYEWRRDGQPSSQRGDIE